LAKGNPSTLPPRARIATVQERLLQWYAASRRDLPWRRTRDPYRILVSEVMLQQTQVDRVVPKYEAFLRRFPTLAALAEAPLAEVIREWTPLGYNRRAVNLHRLARHVVERGGALPTTAAALRDLPGVGAYTAAAVASFAFGEQVAVVDTNVRRVLARLVLGREPSPDLRPTFVETLAEELLPEGRAADWNQALMDLGATICVARRPACVACPLVDLCAAVVGGEVQERGPAYRAGPAARRTEPFHGSRRYYRGRVVAALCALPPGASLDLPSLGRKLKGSYREEDLPWLDALVSELEADGLVRLRREPHGDLASVLVSLP